MKRWYEELFTGYAETYDQESFTKGTLGECDFVEKEIGADKSVRILDIGCGTGRHAIELARRGYRVTGVDLSADQIARAKKKAEAAAVKIDFQIGDARELAFRNEFELAMILCEGAFPLMETDEENFRILEGAARALRPGGKFIMTTLSALAPLTRSVQDFLNQEMTEGRTTEYAFDLMTFRAHSVLTLKDDAGRERKMVCDERHYAPSEIRWLLHSLGFTDIAIHGATLGAFSREDPLKPDEYEMLVLAVKRG